MVARGAMEKGERAGRVAGNHAADAGGGFGGIGREEIAGGRGGADGVEGGARLNAQRVAGSLDGGQARQIQDEPTLRNGAAGYAGARALDSDGPAVGAGFGQGGQYVLFAAGKDDLFGVAGAARFVAQIIAMTGLKRFTHAPNITCFTSCCTDKLPDSSNRRKQ